MTKLQEEQAKELRDRFVYLYGQTDGTLKFPNSCEGDLLRMTARLIGLDNHPSPSRNLLKDDQSKQLPIQPVIVDEHGTLRFKSNNIVNALLNTGKLTMNNLACMDFSPEDRCQFAQLIGYSLSGYGELSYVSSDAYQAAMKVAEGLDERDAKIAVLTEELNAIRNGLRKPISDLYGIHPDDLKS